MRKALIAGIRGQDGSYVGGVPECGRLSGAWNPAAGQYVRHGRIDHLYKDAHDPEARLFLYYGHLMDGSSLRRILQKVEPEEIYNFGAQSHVKVSFDQSEYTADVVAVGPPQNESGR